MLRCEGMKKWKEWRGLLNPWLEQTDDGFSLSEAGTHEDEQIQEERWWCGSVLANVRCLWVCHRTYLLGKRGAQKRHLSSRYWFRTYPLMNGNWNQNMTTFPQNSKNKWIKFWRAPGEWEQFSLFRNILIFKRCRLG